MIRPIYRTYTCNSQHGSCQPRQMTESSYRKLQLCYPPLQSIHCSHTITPPNCYISIISASKKNGIKKSPDSHKPSDFSSYQSSKNIPSHPAHPGQTQRISTPYTHPFQSVTNGSCVSNISFTSMPQELYTITPPNVGICSNSNSFFKQDSI